jgi:16S rRNA (guanine527-N7)-methyltransferase
VTPNSIAELLTPFQVGLDETRLHQISIYIDLLLRWNVRINLTAIRDPEEIVIRHFGESFFAAKHLFPRSVNAHLIDVGSGPGFPGLPIKLWNPSLNVTLIESNQKKTTFLREVIRALTLTDINVFPARAETHPTATADVVTLRAVEHFDKILPTAIKLLSPGGRLALLIGFQQVPAATRQPLKWDEPIKIPHSQARVILVGTLNAKC